MKIVNPLNKTPLSPETMVNFGCHCFCQAEVKIQKMVPGFLGHLIVHAVVVMAKIPRITMRIIWKHIMLNV